MKITFPAFEKWRVNRIKNRKIALTRNEALMISAMLEQLRLTHWDKDWKPKIEEMEAVVDAQLFGKVKVNGEWVKA
jgi:hypothetical protein